MVNFDPCNRRLIESIDKSSECAINLVLKEEMGRSLVDLLKSYYTLAGVHVKHFHILIRSTSKH